MLVGAVAVGGSDGLPLNDVYTIQPLVQLVVQQVVVSCRHSYNRINRAVDFPCGRLS